MKPLPEPNYKKLGMTSGEYQKENDDLRSHLIGFHNYTQQSLRGRSLRGLQRLHRFAKLAEECDFESKG